MKYFVKSVGAFSSQWYHKKDFLTARWFTFNKKKTMIQKNKKQFGVWMDTQNATIIGREDVDTGAFVVLGHVNNSGADRNSSENAENNQEIALKQKFFKEIAALMPNVDQIHITGTGQIQEEFSHFLADTAQYKNAEASDSTSIKMSDEDAIAYFVEYFK
jgi:stalled ribosome rescue protein Dom34